MSTVEVKISQLRDAAVHLEHTAAQIEQSSHTVRHLLDELLAGHLKSDAGTDLTSRYHAERGDMETWAQQLREFARELKSAASQIEEALSANRVYGQDVSGLSQVLVPAASVGNIVSALPMSIRNADQPGRILPPEKPREIESRPVPLETYVSFHNRTAYENLTRKQNLLEISRNQLDELADQRAEQVSEIAALKNRLVSFDADIDVDNSPRVVALETQLAQTDSDINAVNHRIDMLQGDIGELTQRLERVAPGAGADLDLIAGLEGGNTNEWIKQNTEGCVNHIVHRMAIPEGIPADAYLWDDNAARLTEYGITSGDVPLEGSVLLMEPEHSYSDDGLGHLMYVERVVDGEVWITDNDHAAPVRLSDLTEELTGDRLKYLYFPWHTKA